MGPLQQGIAKGLDLLSDPFKKHGPLLTAGRCERPTRRSSCGHSCIDIGSRRHRKSTSELAAITWADRRERFLRSLKSTSEKVVTVQLRHECL
jgi:hypothetical protein